MKKILAVILLLGILVTCCGCTTIGNNRRIDTTFTFKRAIIHLPNGNTVEGTVDWWTDFESGDEIELKVNGKVYLTHYSNVIMISE